MCIVSLSVLRGAKKNGGDKRDVTRERRGTMVWHIALSSPRRRSDLTVDLRIARISPRILISAYARCPRFFVELITAPNSMKPRYPQTRNMNVFTKRRVVHKPSAMVLDRVTTIDQWANLDESTTAPFAALEFSFWHQVMHSPFWYAADVRVYYSG